MTAHNGSLTMNQRKAMTPRGSRLQGRAALKKSATQCAYRPTSPAAREVGCPLDHCACGTHDVDHQCSMEDGERCELDFPTVFRRGGHGVDVKLSATQTTRDIYWSPRKPTGGGFNSYALCEREAGEWSLHLSDGRAVSLFSINGLGEIRWDVPKYEVLSAVGYEAKGTLDPTWDCAEFLLAARHFGLVEATAIDKAA